jgi:hypothetical protein
MIGTMTRASRILLGLLGLALYACGTATPSPSAGGMNEALPALILRGATIHETVSGDAGCPGSSLRSNALRVVLSVPGDDNRYEVHLFRWRRAADFEAAARAFADCVEEYLAGAEGEVPIDEVEESPWRAYGPGWSEEILAIVEGALEEVGGATR